MRTSPAACVLYLPACAASQAVPPSTSSLGPTDSLITTCTYDTTGRTNTTVMGESTQDEMWVADDGPGGWLMGPGVAREATGCELCGAPRGPSAGMALNLVRLGVRFSFMSALWTSWKMVSTVPNRWSLRLPAALPTRLTMVY